MAVFITGDVHGDFSRFKKEVFYEQAELTKDDYIILRGYRDKSTSPRILWWKMGQQK